MRRFAPLMIVVLALACVASANLLVNPGMEIGGAGFGAKPDGWFGANNGGNEGWAAHTGTNGYGFWAWDNGQWAYFGQEVYTNLVAGDVVSLSIYGMAQEQFTSSVNEAYIKIEFWTNSGAQSAVANFDVYSLLTSDRNNWNLYSYQATNTAADITLVKVVIGSGNWTNNGIPGNRALSWDDADMTIAIPEPTMAALFGFAGLIFLAARRMVRK
jgi:hypothetical protein